MASLFVDITLPRRRFTVRLSLELGRETLALLGPSGSGKTSVLRALSGLERPVAGQVTLNGRVLFAAERGVDVPVEDRRIGYVFQEYALFPHMNVARNVAFGGRTRAQEMMDRFRIAHLADAHPGELSGGERQRVALARALAGEPDMLVLDEPLAALDAHTRAAIRRELGTMLRDLDLPVIIVTHDVDDARVLADRVGVIEDGRLSRLGTPDAVLADPRDPFVATMVGANVLPATAVPNGDGLTRVVLDDGTTLLSRDVAEGRVDVIIHPNEISVVADDDGDAPRADRMTGTILTLTRTGARTRLQVGPLMADVASSQIGDLTVGRSAVVTVDAAVVRLSQRP